MIKTSSETMFDTSARSQKIAIIGTGISGLSAAYLLSKDYNIKLYEKSHTGGHSHSVNVGDTDHPIFIDMGFIVFNEACYPNLVALFNHLHIDHDLADMSFGVSMNEGELEYSSLNLFAQKRNLLRPRFLTLLSDIMRFYKCAPIDSEAVTTGDYRLGDYLTDQNYSQTFIEDHLLPQAAAIWSTSALLIMDYPLKAFIAFFKNHGLLELDVKKRIPWRSVRGGAQAYLSALTQGFKDKISSKGAVRVNRTSNSVIITDSEGHEETFDQVIMACHADEAHALLQDKDEAENTILSSFRYTMNDVVLHTDDQLMPKRRSAWSSWNYIGRSGQDDKMLCVTYWMNRLQTLDTKKDYFVTLNPITPIAPSKIIKQIEFHHPLFNAASLRAQNELHRLQGQRNTWFCGAYFGSGFHEDGLQSGLAVAEALSGLKRPWSFDQAQARISYRSDLSPTSEALAAQ